MSDSVRPHTRQPTGLRRPWDSPGKNTGVGCHFLLQYMKVESESEVAQSRPTRLLRPWDFPGKSTGVGCHFLLQKYTIIESIHACFFTLCFPGLGNPSIAEQSHFHDDSTSGLKLSAALP